MVLCHTGLLIACEQDQDGENSTCFGQLLCPSLGVFHCTQSNGICHRGLLTPCEQVTHGTDPARKLSALDALISQI
jgi:hypothetical protein